jgi:tetratricopeptide (TPR) repeat protein/S1-C subfamily serine protease
MNKQLTIIPLCLLAIACTQSQPPPEPSVAASLSAKNLAYSNTTSPEKIARQITVRILVGDRFSSGTIIAKRGNRYTILTNAHVTSKGNSYRITTPDGKTYPAQCAQPLKQGGCTASQSNDLALLEFTANQTYTVPTWGDSRSLTPGETIYSAGFPFDRRDLKTNIGKMDIQTNKPLQGGYQIGFNLVTEPGMSGGSLLNSQGQLIGIIGFSSYPILNEGYQYQDGSQPAASEIAQWRKSSFAIPMATLATIDRQYAKLLPKTGNTTTIASNNYTGVVKKVDDIAQQITVRIEDKNGGNGSGVIVAREGDTYYVATAAHVIQEPRDDRQKIAIAVVTPTQERIVLSAGDINVVNKDLDIGVVKFKSKQNYQIANIGRSEFARKDWVFVSGFPGKDRRKQRSMTIGIVMQRDETEFIVKDKYSLSEGRNLSYSNLSLPGMSGGAVLDRQGRLVGINTGAENEVLATDGEYRQINSGLALGIPMTTVIGATSRGQIPTARLKRATQLLPESTLQEDGEIQRIQLSTLAKPSSTATANDWLDYGNLLWRGNKQVEAVTAFETAIKLVGRQPAGKEQLRIAYLGIGLARWDLFKDSRTPRKQDLQSAVVAFQQAVKVDPKFSPSLRYLGLSLGELGRYDQAVTAYKQAIALGESFVLYEELGYVLRHLKRYPEAINAYNQAIKLKPNHHWAYTNRGVVYAVQKQYPQAIADFNRAIKLAPNDALVYQNRGVVNLLQKQYTQAIADFNQAIGFDPNNVVAYIKRGSAYATLKQYTQAIADYNQAIKINPQDANTYIDRGLVYRNLGQSDLAMADFDRAIKIDPQNANAYTSRGFFYADLRKYPQAIAEYDRAIKFDSSSALTYYSRGVAYLMLKQSDRAMTDLNQSIKLDPNYAFAYINRGLIYEELKQYSQAIADYDRAITIDPNDPWFYYNRGLVYIQQKQYSQAKADLQKTAKLYRDQNDTAGEQRVMKILKEL